MSFLFFKLLLFYLIEINSKMNFEKKNQSKTIKNNNKRKHQSL